MVESARSVALLPSEPAATVSTRTAGVVEFLAAFSWRCASEMPDGLLLPELPGCAGGGVRSSLLETAGDGQAARRVSGEVLALTEKDLAAALDAALRASSELAALSEAVLETRAIRRAAPREVPAHLAERLGRDLSEEGFEVRFAPAWAAADGAELSVGAEGMRRELEEFLTRRAGWRLSGSSR